MSVVVFEADPQIFEVLQMRNQNMNTYRKDSQ
jgi:hypothetical protein